MSLSKIKDILVLSAEEIDQEILLGKKQLFRFRIQRATKEPKYKKHAFPHLKHRLNQLLMVQAQKRTASTSQAQKRTASTSQPKK